MSKLEFLQCKACGGHIDRDTLTCNHCGAMYRLNEEFQPMRIEVSQMKIDTLHSKTVVPSYYVAKYGEEVMKHTLNEMAHNMAQKILPLIEFQTEFDVAHNEYVTYGRLRVVNPHKR